MIQNLIGMEVLQFDSWIVPSIIWEKQSCNIPSKIVTSFDFFLYGLPHQMSGRRFPFNTFSRAYFSLQQAIQHSRKPELTIFRIIGHHLLRSKPDVDRSRNAWLELFKTADDLDTCILRFFKNSSEFSKHGGGGRSFKITGPDLNKPQEYSE